MALNLTSGWEMEIWGRENRLLQRQSFSPCWVVARWRDPQMTWASALCGPYAQFLGGKQRSLNHASKYYGNESISWGSRSLNQQGAGRQWGCVAEGRWARASREQGGRLGCLKPFSVVSQFPLALNQAYSLRAERIFGDPVFFMRKMMFKSALMSHPRWYYQTELECGKNYHPRWRFETRKKNPHFLAPNLMATSLSLPASLPHL